MSKQYATVTLSFTTNDSEDVETSTVSVPAHVSATEAFDRAEATLSHNRSGASITVLEYEIDGLV